MSAPEPVDTSAIADAAWFPIDLDVVAGRWSFLRLEPDVLERSTFMDDRMDVEYGRATVIGAEAVAGAIESLPNPPQPPAWLFHTSFCGSTLFARALHLPPSQVSLKEPLVLRRLADAHRTGRSIDVYLPQVIALLARPWATGAGVAIKPTHVALGIADRLMAATPGSRALVLTSSLEDFLVSNLKKSRDSQAKLPELAERALQGTRLLTQLPAGAFQPPDVLCAAALQWAGQRQRVADLVAKFGEQRVRTLEFDAWVRQLEETIVQSSKWLRLPAAAEELRGRARQVGRYHAKAAAVSYDAQQREAEAARIRDAYSGPLQRARNWVSQFVLPAMSDTLQAKP